MNNPYYGFPPPQNEGYYLQLKKAEKKDIRFFSKVAGMGVIAYVIVQNVIGIPLFFSSTLNDLYFQNEAFQCLFGIFNSLLGVLVPFLVCAKVLKKRKGAEVYEFGRPADKSVMFLLLPIAFVACLAANYLTSMLTVWLETIGVKLSGGEYSAPADAFGKVIYVIEIAFIPPLCEEFAMRGVVMQPLRRYGDRFAIIASAFVFAVMHGNLVQAPFAFIVGLVVGYCVCITRSIWTGVLIHFLNNGYSVLLDFAGTGTLGNIVYYSVLAVAVILGIICAIILFTKHRGSLGISRGVGKLTSAEKAAAFILTVPMIIALGIMAFITSQYVEITGSF